MILKITRPRSFAAATLPRTAAHTPKKSEQKTITVQLGLYSYSRSMGVMEESTPSQFLLALCPNNNNRLSWLPANSRVPKLSWQITDAVDNSHHFDTVGMWLIEDEPPLVF